MNNLFKSLFIIAFIMMLQLFIYALFLEPVITTWGASKAEITMPMVGDNSALTITSTRAIWINAPKHVVWRGLMQLGADRRRFYSYEFLENALGYKTRYPDLIIPKFKDLKEGDMVRGSADEQSSIIPYNFRVLYIKPEDTFVLQNWGTFLLEAAGNEKTRLLIRTQETKSTNRLIKSEKHLFVPFHFIMERRMLIGIKVWSEPDKNTIFSQRNDIIWFASSIFSWLLVCFIVFLGRGVLESVIVPIFFNLLWLLDILLLEPIPLYSSMLLLVITCTFGRVIYVRTKKQPAFVQRNSKSHSAF